MNNTELYVAAVLHDKESRQTPIHIGEFIFDYHGKFIGFLSNIVTDGEDSQYATVHLIEGCHNDFYSHKKEGAK
jgi:hypothetical protein